MLDFEKVESKLKFGDLVRVKTLILKSWIYSIYIYEDDDFYFTTECNGIFHKVSKSVKIERIGSAIDENIINLLKKGDE